MKRFIAAGLLLLAGVIVTYGFTMTRRERLYRQHVVRGDYALARRDTYTAVSAFSAAIALKADSMLGYLKRGEARLRRGELDDAAHDLATASTLDPSATKPLEFLGDVEAARRRPDTAADYYDACVRLDDRAPHVLYKLGLARYLAGRHAEAADALTKAVSLDDRLAEAQYLRGVALRELHRPRDAQRALERAVALSSSLQAAREQLADLYGEIGQKPARIDELEALLASDPQPSRLVTLALAYAQAGQVPRAVRLLGNATQRYPDHGETYVALGRIWLDVARSGDDRIALSKAIEALQLAVGMEPSSHALALLGEARLAAADPAGAEQVLRQAVEKVPADSATFLTLADAAERSGHPQVARRALLDYHSVTALADSRRSEIARRIGDLSMRLREPRAAVVWYQRVAEATRQTTPPLLVRLAEAQLEAGDRAAAGATLARVFEIEPDNASARMLEHRLR